MTKKIVVADFKEFWKAYPIHKNRPAARGAWHKLSPDKALLGVMLKAIAAQKRSGGLLAQREKGSFQFVPYPASWLMGKRWEDSEDIPELDKELYVSREYDLQELIKLEMYPNTKGGTNG